MFTTLEKPRLELGLVFPKAIRLQRIRLNQHERSGARMSEWEGVILCDGEPVYNISTNYVCWKLIPISKRDYNALSEYDQTVNCRTVWFGEHECRQFRIVATDL